MREPVSREFPAARHIDQAHTVRAVVLVGGYFSMD